MKTITPILVIAVFSLICAACVSQASTPTITFEDDRCEYSGPDSIQADQFTFEWVMNSQQFAENYIWANQLEEGHSADELIGLTALPPWALTLRSDSGQQPGPWTKEVTWDLTESARYQPRPVYFGCGHRIEGGEITVYGVVGPVEVED